MTFFYKGEKFKCRNPKCKHIQILKRGTNQAPRCKKCKSLMDLQ
jgi:hypothetical protein